MKKTILLGDNFKVDLPKLMETRLLVAANSGGGKSWALRRLLEQTNGEIQQIVIDLEGEFYSLREKFDDYLLIGKGGDMNADVRAAALLATKLLELDASAIIDLSELKFHDRKRFVRLFLESLIEAPEELRHPCMVVLDEAHHFCPQVGESEATAAVIDLMTRGRKRELCGVLATQRVSKLHKDAIAECNNKMFGRTGQDIDVKRTSDELGFAKSAREAFDTLRNLKAGEFFAFGTAIGTTVERYQVGTISTTHVRRAGDRKVRKATEPKAAIRSILEKLKDLPQEAEQKARSEKELRQEIATLKMQLAKKNEPIPLTKQGLSAKQMREELEKAIEPHLIALQTERNAWKLLVEQWQEYGRMLLTTSKNNASAILRDLQSIEQPKTKPAATYSGKMPVHQSVQQKTVVDTPQRTSDDAPIYQRSIVHPGGGALSGAPLRLLRAVAYFFPEACTRSQAAIVATLKQRSSTFRNAISKLNTMGLIVVQGETLGATPDGVGYLGDDAPEKPASPEARIARWFDTFSGSAHSMFRVLIQYHDEGIDWVTREDLAGRLGMDMNISTFRNAISKLNSTGVVETRGNQIRASQNLWEK